MSSNSAETQATAKWTMDAPMKYKDPQLCGHSSRGLADDNDLQEKYEDSMYYALAEVQLRAGLPAQQTSEVLPSRPDLRRHWNKL